MMMMIVCVCHWRIDCLHHDLVLPSIGGSARDCTASQSRRGQCQFWNLLFMDKWE